MTFSRDIHYVITFIILMCTTDSNKSAITIGLTGDDRVNRCRGIPVRPRGIAPQPPSSPSTRHYP